MSQKDLNLSLYKKVYLVRQAEETLRKYYPEDEMKTPTHLSIGEEAIVAGIAQAMGENDQVLSTYRGHGIYLARTEETDRFFAELYGKKTGLAKGKTGSMHLHAIDQGFMGSSAVVATSIPVAVGCAYANKVAKNGKLVFSLFGDGATEEGAFWESLNMACLKQIPIIFICEDNDLAIHTQVSERQGYRSISEIVSKYNCHVFSEDTTDPEKIYALTKVAVDQAKTTGSPSFIYLKYYRYLEHVGVNEDFNANYRSKEEYLKWFEKDPVKLQREKLIKMGCEKDVLRLEKEINQQIETSIERAKMAPFASLDELKIDVYAHE